MAMIWVVAADSEYARVLEAPTAKGELTEINTLVCSTARQHEQDLVSDRPGRTFDRAGGGRHSMEPTEHAKRTEAVRFAKQIADHIEKGWSQKKYQRLVLIAPPAFLGHLRASLNNNAAKAVSLEIDKNLVRLEAAELRKHLPEYI